MTAEERLEKLEKKLSRGQRFNRWLLAGLVFACHPATALAQPADINARCDQLEIGKSTLQDVIEVFGEPERYSWQRQTLSKDNLPGVYMAEYPRRLRVVMSRDVVHEIRHHEPGYRFKDKIQVGSPLSEVLEVLSPPARTVEGEKADWEDGVLYKDIEGKQGHHYYSRRDQGVRFFFSNDRVAALYLTDTSSGGGGSFTTVRPIDSVKEYDDVRYRDMSKLDLSGMPGLIETLRFNTNSVWPQTAKMPPGLRPAQLLGQAKSPGLGVRLLHQRGIKGEGVNVAIIDQAMYLDHPEFAGKVAEYHDLAGGEKSSMHGPAVASLLVGTQCGTAPGARVYYAATRSGCHEADNVKALHWIIETNRTLPEGQKVRVVSVSAAPGRAGTPVETGQETWPQALAQAKSEDILVLDCTEQYGFIGPAWLDIRSPERVDKCRPGRPGQAAPTKFRDLLVPTCPRTTAEEYEEGKHTYAYWGRGGLSWAIPYTAGVLAMGWQVRPDLGPDVMRKLLIESAYLAESGARIINPIAFIRSVQKAR